jgi:3-methyladenine DNA glycosylase AlkD
MPEINDLKKDLEKAADPEKAKLLQRFFKTGKGEYGEGDVFLGIVVPKQREVAKKYQDIELSEMSHLLSSEIHEFRLVALLILTYKLKNKHITIQEKEKIFHFYLKNAQKGNINNWDLVDLSAPNIVGTHLLDKDRKILYKLAKSNNLWEKRISVLATFMFIKYKDYKDSLKIAELLLEDKHDLMHKAVGWMLREIGKRDTKEEEKFLKKHYKKMPRTMLRYAIEKFPENKRQAYLNGKI